MEDRTTELIVTLSCLLKALFLKHSEMVYLRVSSTNLKALHNHTGVFSHSGWIDLSSGWSYYYE